MSKLKVTVASAAVVLCALALPSMAGATTIPVNSLFDNKTDDQLCTLREAVDAANTNAAVNPGGGADCQAGESGNTDTITLAATPTFPYILSGPANDDANVSGDLDITGGGELVIDGTTDGNEVPTTIVDGAHLDRIFDLRPDAQQVKFFAQKLILVHGAVAGSAAGGAIRVADSDADFGISTSLVYQNDAGGNGGGISFDDADTGYTFDVSQVQFSQNNADLEGGAIYIDTPQDNNATVERSTLIENTAGEMGGGAYIESAGSTGAEPVLQFINSTLTGNSAHDGGGAVAFDFGLGGTVWFKFSTIAFNNTPRLGGGGGIFTNSADQFVLFQGGTIVSGNAAGGVLSNCVGPGDYQTLGYNLESGNSCHLDTASPKFDLINTNPLLRMSRINPPGKETTETMGLFSGSPAIDRIPIASCGGAGGFDQRLVSRPQPQVSSNCDVGAFEGDSGAPADAEGDGVNDTVDNCPLDANANQANNDGDFQGDVCDPDDENDGVLDASDNCPTTAGPASNGGCPAPAVATQTPLAVAPPFDLAAAKKKCKKKFPGKANAQRRKKCIKKAKRQAGLA